MNFIKRNAGFIVPVLFAFVAAMNLWEAIQSGRISQYLAAAGFGIAAVMFLISQVRVYKNSQHSGSE